MKHEIEIHYSLTGDGRPRAKLVSIEKDRIFYLNAMKRWYPACGPLKYVSTEAVGHGSEFHNRFTRWLGIHRAIHLYKRDRRKDARQERRRLKAAASEYTVKTRMV